MFSLQNDGDPNSTEFSIYTLLSMKLQKYDNSTIPLLLIIKANANESFKGIKLQNEAIKHDITFARNVKQTKMTLNRNLDRSANIDFTLTRIVDVVTKSARKTPLTKHSSLSTKAEPNGGPSGTAKPKTKAPINGESLKKWVNILHPIATTTMSTMYTSLMGLPSGVVFITQDIIGRNTKKRVTTKAMDPAVLTAATDGAVAHFSMDEKTKTRTKVPTSATADADRANRPSSEFRILSSPRRQAMTEKDVKDSMVAPRKRSKFTSLL